MRKWRDRRILYPVSGVWLTPAGLGMPEVAARQDGGELRCGSQPAAVLSRGAAPAFLFLTCGTSTPAAAPYLSGEFHMATRKHRTTEDRPIHVSRANELDAGRGGAASHSRDGSIHAQDGSEQPRLDDMTRPEHGRSARSASSPAKVSLRSRRSEV
jgi:hypothetical protein